jgi:hypothetical protein
MYSYNWTWNMEDDNSSLRWKKYIYNFTWLLELPVDTFKVIDNQKDRKRMLEGKDGNTGDGNLVTDSVNSGSRPDNQIYIPLGWAPWWG